MRWMVCFPDKYYGYYSLYGSSMYFGPCVVNAMTIRAKATTMMRIRAKIKKALESNSLLKREFGEAFSKALIIKNNKRIATRATSMTIVLKFHSIAKQGRIIQDRIFALCLGYEQT